MLSAKPPENLPATSSQEVALDYHPSTSWVLNNLPVEMRPKEPVACMNCPAANWMLEGKTVKAYCRMLYMVVWETTKPGKIILCDAPELARLAAEAKANGG